VHILVQANLLIVHTRPKHIRASYVPVFLLRLLQLLLFHLQLLSTSAVLEVFGAIFSSFRLQYAGKDSHTSPMINMLHNSNLALYFTCICLRCSTSSGVNWSGSNGCTMSKRFARFDHENFYFTFTNESEVSSFLHRLQHEAPISEYLLCNLLLGTVRQASATIPPNLSA
jgi:hypothetical protein